MENNKYYKHCRVHRYVDVFLPSDATLEDLVYIIGGSYGSLFTSTEQKIAAWNLYKKFQSEKKGVEMPEWGKVSEDGYLDHAIHFFFNSAVDADFIEYCAEAEGVNDPVQYLLGLVGAWGARKRLQ